MNEIIRNRTIRPSSRLEKSKSYKINTKGVSTGDVLIVNIDHEKMPFKKTFRFNGRDVSNKDSISFSVKEIGNKIEIRWSGAQPIGTNSDIKQSLPSRPARTKAVVNSSKPNQFKEKAHQKTSFPPISNSDTSVLILGTMPGDKSLELAEYYGHPRNRFWKIISAITKNEMPTTYRDKINLLAKTKIGVWDVAHKAVRKGSLDSAIEGEEPNDLLGFIAKHKNLKVIGFNGAKSEALFDKYFQRESGIRYIALPSSSPANTSIDFVSICIEWCRLLSKEKE